MSIVDLLVADPTSFIHYLPHDLILHYIKPYVQPNIRYMCLCAELIDITMYDVCIMFSHTREKYNQDQIILKTMHGRQINHTFGAPTTDDLHFNFTYTVHTNGPIGIMMVYTQSDNQICLAYDIEFYSTITDLYEKLVPSWSTDEIDKLINHKQKVTRHGNYYDFTYKVYVLSPTTFWIN